MKQHDNTIVPRQQKLNKALVDLGHKVHSDKRTKKLNRDKYKKQQKEQLEDDWYS